MREAHVQDDGGDINFVSFDDETQGFWVVSQILEGPCALS